MSRLSLRRQLTKRGGALIANHFRSHHDHSPQLLYYCIIYSLDM